MSKKLKQHGIWPVMAILLFISIYSVIQLIADENGASTAEISLITTSTACDKKGGSGLCGKDEDTHEHDWKTDTITDPYCSGSEIWEIVGPDDADAVYLIDKKITAYSVKMKTDSDTKIAGVTTVKKECECKISLPPTITTHIITPSTFTWTVTGCGAEPATGTGEKAEFTPKTTGKGTITFSVLTPPKCDYEESLVATISPASKSFIVPKVDLISLQFISDHQTDNSETGNLLKKSYKDDAPTVENHSIVGSVYKQPEWIPDKEDPDKTRNNPITHTMGEKLKIQLKVKVSPAGMKYVIESDVESDMLRFKSQERISTGEEEIIEMEAQEAIYNKVAYISKATIKWKATLVKEKLDIDLGISGPHEIFLTMNTPNETCSRDQEVEYTLPWDPNPPPMLPLSNALTYKRILFTTTPCTNLNYVNEQQYIDDCAKAIYNKVNNSGIIASGNTALAGNIWGLLDQTQSGQCVPQAFLLEISLRLTGIGAEFKYITAAKEAPVFETDGKSAPQFYSRTHTGHGEEWLFFIFPDTVPKRNPGEGTCLVNGKYYPGWLDEAFISNSALDLLKKFDKTDGYKQQWYYWDNGLKECDFQDFPNQ